MPTSYLLVFGLFAFGNLYAQQNHTLQQAESYLQEALKLGDNHKVAIAYQQMGQAYRSKDKQQAYTYYMKSLDYLDSINQPKLWEKSQRSLGKVAFRMGEYPLALAHYKKAESIAEKVDSYTIRATLQRNFGDVYYRLGKMDESMKHLLKAKEIYETMPDMDSLYYAGLLVAIGTTYAGKSNIPEALYWFTQGETIYREINNQTHLPYVLNNIGATYIKIGNYPRGLDYAQQALQMAESSGAERLASSASSNMGIVYMSMKEFEKAIPFYEKSKKLADRVGNKGYQASINQKLGNTWLHLGDKQKAMSYFQEALKLYHESGARHGLGITHKMIAAMYIEEGEDEKVSRHIDAALRISQEIGDEKTISHNYSFLGEWALKKKEYDKAVRHCLKGLDYARKIHMYREIESNCYCLWRAYEKLGEYRKVAGYLEEYMAARDSLVSEAKIADLTRLEMQYEFDKEKEVMALNQKYKEDQLNSELARQSLQRNMLFIGLLLGGIVILLLWRAFQINRQKNRALAIQKSTLESALNDRETLLKEIHHRVKNNLQVVSSLLSLQSRTIRDQAALDAIQEGRNRVRAMALIHQNLYQEENLIGVDLKSYIEKLTDSLINSYRIDTDQISIKRKVAALPLDVDTIIPLGLILNELISNALKYAFKGREEGLIEVNVEPLKDGLEIRVKDNGVGLPENFSIGKTQSLGFKLVQSFVKKMNAQLDIHTQNGTAIRILLPGFNLV